MWSRNVISRWTVRCGDRDYGSRSKYFIIRYHRRGRPGNCQSIAAVKFYADLSCVGLGVRKQRQAKVLWTRHRGYVSSFFFSFLFSYTVRPSATAEDCDKKNAFSSRDIDYNPQRIVRVVNMKQHTEQTRPVTDNANKNVKRPATTCDERQLAQRYCRRCHIWDWYYDENRKIQRKSTIESFHDFII